MIIERKKITDTAKEEKTFNEELLKWVEITKTKRYKYLRNHVLDILKKFKFENKKILELGCGISPYLTELDGNERYGLDLSKELIEKNNPKIAKFIQGDILKCSEYFHIKFDLIFLVGVIHHINKREHSHVLMEIKNILKKGGILLIIEPNMMSVTGIYYLIRKTIEKLLGTRVVKKMIGFSSEDEKYLFPNKFKKELKKRNFAIKKIYSIQLLRLPPIKAFQKINIEKFNKKIDKILIQNNFLFGTAIIFEAKNSEKE